MDRLTEIVRQEIEKYAGPSFNDKSYAVFDDKRSIYTAVSVINTKAVDRVGIIVMIRLEDDWVIIEADNTDKPLVDALIQAGVSREKIVLAYAGESLPSVAVTK